MSSFIVGIPEFEKYLQRTKKNIEEAARLAINTTARDTYSELKKKIRGNVNLSNAYLEGRDYFAPRLQITQLAKNNELEAVIKGRQRATSLMRFEARKIEGGFTVKVGKRTRIIKKAFEVKFKNGNRGLAIRVKKGERIRRKREASRPFASSKTSDAYLLYGPSVQQVVTRVTPELIPGIQRKLAAEFRRQLVRLNGRL